MKKRKAITYSGGVVKKSRRPRTERATAKTPAVKEAEEEMGLIYGKTPGSKWEWNVARAGWALGWQFDYQVPIKGGRRRRGGQVLDFVFPTRPAKTVVSVKGGFWHRDTDIDEIKESDAQRALNTPVRVVTAGKKESETYALAYAFLYQLIGRN